MPSDKSDFDAWRTSLPDDAKRMPWWRELKWLLAWRLIGWAIRLMRHEMSPEGVRAFAALVAAENDPQFDTVPMRPKRVGERSTSKVELAVIVLIVAASCFALVVKATDNWHYVVAEISPFSWAALLVVAASGVAFAVRDRKS